VITIQNNPAVIRQHIDMKINTHIIENVIIIKVITVQNNPAIIRQHSDVKINVITQIMNTVINKHVTDMMKQQIIAIKHLNIVITIAENIIHSDNSI